MADFIPAPKTVRIDQLWSLTESFLASCRFYLSYSGTQPTSAELTAVAGACTAQADTSFAPLTATYNTLSGSRAVDLTSADAPTGEVSDTTAGTRDGENTPDSAAVVISQETANRARGGKSRVYIPVGIADDLLSPNEWTDPLINDTNTAWQAIISAAAGAFPSLSGVVTQVVPSFYSGSTWVEYGTPPKYRRVPTAREAALNYPVINFVARQYVGQQRRRLGKRA